jgi:hypothetical protein
MYNSYLIYLYKYIYIYIYIFQIFIQHLRWNRKNIKVMFKMIGLKKITIILNIFVYYIRNILNIKYFVSFNLFI